MLKYGELSVVKVWGVSVVKVWGMSVVGSESLMMRGKTAKVRKTAMEVSVFSPESIGRI